VITFIKETGNHFFLLVIFIKRNVEPALVLQ
jgi:hypothetical protein